MLVSVHKVVPVLLLLVVTLGFAAQETPGLPAPPAPADKQPTEHKLSVFDMPLRHATLLRAHALLLQHFAQKRYADAEGGCREFLGVYPNTPEMEYNLACSLALQKRTKEALDALDKSVKHGFRDPDKIRSDEDLTSLRDNEQFARILADAGKPLSDESAHVPTPGIPVNRTVFVSESNTVWNPLFQAFVCLIDPPTNRPTLQDPMIGDWKDHDDVAALIRKWYREGSAAGNYGDFYDNHDQDHSNMDYDAFPQLTRIEYRPESHRTNVNFSTGLQEWFIFTRPVIGNSSTALTQGALWRSQPRYAMFDARRMAIQATHYLGNQIYFYPEHRDHDEDYGDTYPANTPYVITSQGSSGSDRDFMNAIAATMASFRPAVKSRLVEAKALVPTLQQIFRQSYAFKGGNEKRHYLSGAAHPVVFDSQQVDVGRMVRLAHAMKSSCLPPVALLGVVNEVPPNPKLPPRISPYGEILFTTPAAVARVYRRMDPVFEIELSAEASRDIDEKKLSYQWIVLQGDSAKITITKLNTEGSRVRVSVPWFDPFPVSPGSKLITSRVDVGLFVNNGTYYSAPAFLSVFRLANETRAYDKHGRLLSIDYRGDGYVDPLLAARKDWKDLFEYNSDGTLTKLTRVRQDGQKEFDETGELIVARDDDGKVVETRPVQYTLNRDDQGVVSMQETVLGE